MSDPMASRLDPVTLSKMARMPQRAGGAGQAASGFESVMQMLKTSNAQKRGNDGSEALVYIEPGDGPPVDKTFWTRQDAPVSAKVVQPPKTEEEKLSRTAYEFEAMLMTQMFQTLRKTVEPSGLFSGNQTERSIYEYLFDQSVFQKAAENGQTWGLAARLEEAWKDHL